MADFYQQMQSMARNLLAPTSQGGLGQGEIKLTRVAPGTPNPDAPWEPVTPTTKTETLRGAVRGVSKELVGKDVGGTVLLDSDRVATCEVPTMQFTAGDVLAVDGVPVHVISYERIPAAGTTAAVRFVIR